MGIKKNISLGGSVTLVGAVLLAMATLLAMPAQAMQGTPPPDSGCLSCHEDLYYLYDTGKWFCQCSTQMTCSCCHGGNAEALTEEEAHLGMVLYPTRNDATTCQQCHPDDYEARVERFSEIAGVSQIHDLPPTPSTYMPVPAEIISSGPLSPDLGRRLGPWQLAGLIAIGIALAVIVILGYRCWRADCLAKKK